MTLSAAVESILALIFSNIKTKIGLSELLSKNILSIKSNVALIKP